MAIKDKLNAALKALSTGPQFSFLPLGAYWQVPPGWNYGQYLKAYGQIGWLFGCVSRIASSVAEVNWHLYKVQRGKEREEIDNHPILDLLHYVNPFQTGQEFIELSQMYMDLVGECFWVLNRDGLGKPGEIWIAPPQRILIVPDRQKFIAGYIYQFGSEKVALDIKDVIQIKLPNPLDPYRGLGPVQAIAVDLDAEKCSAEYNRNFFYNSAEPGGVIEMEGVLSSNQYDHLKEQWSERHMGVSRAHRVAILEGGAKFNRISISQRDMDFWRLRKLNRDVILGAFGVHPHILGISEQVNKANAEAAEISFARRVVRPRLVRLREKINEQLCPMYSDKIEIDFEDPVPEDRELKLREIEAGIKAGYITINEARTAMGLDPVKNGDVFIMPMTMIPTPIKGFPDFKAPQGAFLLPAKGFTEDGKQAYWKVYAAKTEAQERAFIQALRRLWDGQEAEVLRKLEDASTPEQALFDEGDANEEFKKVLKPLIQTVLTEAAEDADALINPEPAHRAVKQDFPLSGDALIWLMDRAAWLVKGINITTRDAISTVLVDGFAEGQGMEEMAKGIRAVFDDCSRRRSLLIARTEVIAASNEGALEGYQSSGVVDKSEFYAALDERTCGDCMSYHGQEFEMKAAHGIIPVHPACRCTWLPVLD